MSLRPPASWFSGVTAFRDFVRWCRETTEQLEPYTVANLPDAAQNVRTMIYVSNAAGGAIPAFSDGTDWRRVDTRAVVT